MEIGYIKHFAEVGDVINFIKTIIQESLSYGDQAKPGAI